MKVESKTTTVGLTTRDYVVLAADKRATAGPAIYHKAVKKIHVITNRAAITISGLVADAQFLVENAKYIARNYELSMGKPLNMKSLASALSLILSAYLRVYPFIVQLLLGGVDDDGSQLYYLDLYGTITRERYMATGSGSPVAFGVLEEGYREGLSLDEAVDLAVKAVTAALMRDGFSGEGVDVLVIGKQGVALEKTIQLKRTLVSGETKM
jgi:proteasome beta subunit